MNSENVPNGVSTRETSPNAGTEIDIARSRILRRRRRRRTGYFVLAVVAAVAVAGTVIQQQRTAIVEIEAPALIPHGAGADWTSISVTQGSVRVEVYLDYLCPSCKEAEYALNGVVSRIVTARAIELVYHPVAMLDDYSEPAGYSTRAAAAAGCAADHGKLREFSSELFARQPPERSPGLTDEQLISIGGALGINPRKFEECVRSGQYTEWANRATDKAYASGIVGTPVVIVDGHRVAVEPDTLADDLLQAVADAARWR